MRRRLDRGMIALDAAGPVRLVRESRPGFPIMVRLHRLVLPLVVTLALAGPRGISAQMNASLGAGVAVPTGDLGDVTGTGFTVRGQAGLSLALIEAYLQAGWSSFPGKDIDAGDAVVEGEDADIWHAGIGVRLGFSMFWIGGNALYSFGDTPDDGFGFAPEAGVALGPIEVVADYLFGKTNWVALRAGFRF